MIYILILTVLFGMELLYFRIAAQHNIIDKPNERSSHSQLTLRGGGVIIPMGVLLYFGLFGFSYPWFTLGLAIIAAVSFADDVKEQSPLLRFFLQFASVVLMLYQAGFGQQVWWLALLALIVIVGTINAYNFMDGINGISVGYGFVLLLSLWMANRTQNFVDPNYLYVLGLALLVFGYFNFRTRARCFAGDVGSISLAFCLVFPTLLLMLATGNLLFILFFALYGVDTVLTLIHRLYKRENIFTAHRQHLFQYLANEKGWPHVQVTAVYMLVQLAINLGTLYVWTNYSGNGQWIFALVVLGGLGLLHTVLKFRILNHHMAQV